MRSFVFAAMWSLASLSFAPAAPAHDAGVAVPPGAATSAASAAPASAASEAAHIERIELPGLPNLAHVEGNIYRGGRPQLAQGGAESLRALGIRAVVDLQGGDFEPPAMARVPEWPRFIAHLEPGETPHAIAAEAAAAKSIGAVFVHTPLDSLDPINDAEADELEQILDVLGHASGDRRVYVHCEHGKDRTGLVIALYRVRFDGWSPAKAAAEMAEMGHVGRLDEYFTGNMDIVRVLALHPSLGRAATAPALPPAPASAAPSQAVSSPK